MYKNGYLYPLTENIQVNYAKSYLQDNNERILFDVDGNAHLLSSQRLFQRITGGKHLPQHGSPFDGFEDVSWEVIGVTFRLVRVCAQYRDGKCQSDLYIDRASGVINLYQHWNGASVVLSNADGMENGRQQGSSTSSLVVYAYIEYHLEQQVGWQEYVVNRARKERVRQAQR